MNTRRIRTILGAATALIAVTVATNAAHAAIVVNASVGGAPTGVSYVNFDNLPLGPTGGTSGGVGVSFVTDGQVVTGSSSGTYAAPYLSNSNGTLFGDPTVSGQDTTQYISTGIGTVTLTLPGLQQYLGLLWGSVDDFNTLTFYSGANLVGAINGLDVTASATGDQGVNGTYYVNITSDIGFDSVVASSAQYAFEFDNLAFNQSIPTDGVPEPLSLGLLGLGIAGLGLVRRRKAAADARA